VTALVLDTRALEVIADHTADPAGSRRVRNMLAAAARIGVPVRVSTAVLSEAYRVPQLTPRSITSFAGACARPRWAVLWHESRAVYAPTTGLTRATRPTPSSSPLPCASEVALWRLPTLATCGLSLRTTPAFESNQSADAI